VTAVARFVSRAFTGVFAGFLVAVLVLESSLRGYDGPVYTQVRHVELDRLDVLASATLLPALVAVAVLVFRTRQRDRVLGLVALALLIGVLVTTLLVNLPINAAQLDWSVPTPPADWAAVRDRWQIAHALRTAAAVIAFASLIVPSRVSRPAG
jgi:uncharacterized membrane protein